MSSSSPTSDPPPRPLLVITGIVCIAAAMAFWIQQRSVSPYAAPLAQQTNAHITAAKQPRYSVNIDDETHTATIYFRNPAVRSRVPAITFEGLTRAMKATNMPPPVVTDLLSMDGVIDVSFPDERVGIVRYRPDTNERVLRSQIWALLGDDKR